MSSEPQKHQIGPAVLTLLALYWQPDEGPEVQRMIVAAWLEDLTEFTAAIVTESCREWRRMHTQRPKLADIYQLCRENQRLAAERDERVLPPPPLGVPAWFAADKELVSTWRHPEDNGDIRLAWERRCAALATAERKVSREVDVIEGRAINNAWAREHGYPDFDTAIAAYKAADRPIYSEVLAWSIARQPPKLMPLAPGERAMSAAEKDRVRRQREIEVSEPEYTADEMAKARRELGLPEPPLPYAEAAE